MTSSSEVSKSFTYISSSSEESTIPLTFKVRLYHDYKQQVWLPKVPGFENPSRWILINTPHGRTYKIETKENNETILLERGWYLLAAIENLQEGDKLIFQIQANNALNMWIHSPSNHLPAIGFSPERILGQSHKIAMQKVILNKGTEINSAVKKAIKKVWNTSSIDGRIYVCRLLISPSEGNFLILNKAYTRLVPRQNEKVAMRFISSNIIMPSAIKTYRDGSARMVKEWPLYATQHYLTFGETFVCKIHRGPAVWEFVGCCARA